MQSFIHTIKVDSGATETFFHGKPIPGLADRVSGPHAAGRIRTNRERRYRDQRGTATDSLYGTIIDFYFGLAK